MARLAGSAKPCGSFWQQHRRQFPRCAASVCTVAGRPACGGSLGLHVSGRYAGGLWRVAALCSSCVGRGGSVAARGRARYSPAAKRKIHPREVDADTDHYRILNIRKNATAGEIKSAFHRAARRAHPDSNATAAATVVFPTPPLPPTKMIRRSVRGSCTRLLARQQQLNHSRGE